jgi:S-DNA-T family DNA segregation ATPase FtsK/SpoIIIE
MARKKTKENKTRSIKESLENKISPETKNSVVAVFLIGLTAILILAGFQKAGPVGGFIYNVFEGLFGWGYFLFPIISLFVAVLFILTKERIFFGITLIGAIAFILSGLGLIDIVSSQKAGLIGNFIGGLELFFGYTASIILMAIFLISALLVTFNASIHFTKKPETKKLAVEPIIISKPEPEIKLPKSGIIETEKTEKKTQESKPASLRLNPRLNSKDYTIPSLDLLKSSSEKPSAGDLRANANIIKRTLEGFGIPVEMGEITIGPKVTRYTLKPAEGIKLSRITALNQDLSLALAAHPIRIEAPIPGKSLVGIEVPNKAAALVRLGNLINYQEFASRGLLVFILGRDVSGEPIFADIEKMPHLLIAGSTGSGKSITIHSLLISLLYKNSPKSLRLILIDPKRVELSVYEGIPHLIAPVITDGKKTIAVFRWAISEMERRYEILLNAGSRDISIYNKSSNEPLPYLLIVIDELADLMASYGREIENSIIRLAQMARATGIHLIVSTQRPSVEVITGLIKANITARVALQVASQVDSRTILDAAGAEKLLGGGDLLFISSEFSKPKRIQGAYISEEEINKVVNFIKKNNKAILGDDAEEMSIQKAIGEPANGGQVALDEYMMDNEDDELYESAVELVKKVKRASASLLQRHLKIGYARAARLLDMMEAKGLIGPGEGAKPREVYIKENES